VLGFAYHIFNLLDLISPYTLYQERIAGGMHSGYYRSIFSLRVVVWWQWTNASIARMRSDAGKRGASPGTLVT